MWVVDHLVESERYREAHKISTAMQMLSANPGAVAMKFDFMDLYYREIRARCYA